MQTLKDICNNTKEGHTEVKVYKILDELNIKYERVDHKPVFTSEEANECVAGLLEDGIRCKNLFLKDSKNYYLYFIMDNKMADLKDVRSKIGSSRLSFASEEKLYEMLKLTRGSVTPLGIVNDCGKVILLLDKDIIGHKVLMHPELNTTTISMEYDDLIRFINHFGNKYIEI